MQPLILLHGALGAAASMLPLSKELDPVAEVHIMDFSGHGEARPPELGFGIEAFEADVLRFMDARQLHAAHIFGYSMGGFVGLRLAARVPDRIRSVTTLATKLDWTEETCRKEAAMLDADMMEAKVPRFVAGLAALHHRSGWRTLVDYTREMLLEMHRFRLTESQLRKMEQPLLLAIGDRDKMVSIEETLFTYRSLPNGALAVLPRTPHPLESVDRKQLAALIQGNMAKAQALSFNLLS